MPYIPPNPQEVKQCIQSLRSSYKGHNGERLSLIQLIEAINNSSTITEDAKRGAMSIGIAKIDTTYYLSPGKKVSLFSYEYKHGGDLRDLLSKGLHCSHKNQPDEEEHIISLAHLYHELEINSKYYEELIKSLQPKAAKGWLGSAPAFWRSLAELKEHILSVVMPHVFSHSKSWTEELNKAMNENTWREELARVVEEYRKLAKGNTDHDKLINFVDFINTIADVYISGEPNKKEMKLDDEAAKLFSRGYQLRLAMICFIMEEIENERVIYRKSFGLAKPEGGWLNKGSDLFKLARQSFNLESIDDLSPAERKGCLAELFALLTEQKFPVLLKIAAGKKIDPSSIATMEEHLQAFQDKILAQLAKINSLPPQSPATASGKFADNVAYLAEYGVNTLISQGAAFLVPDVGQQTGRAVGAYVGFLAFGPLGSFLGAIAGGHVVSKVVPSTVSGGVICTAKPITQKIGKATGVAIAVPIYIVEGVLKFALSDDPMERAEQEDCLGKNAKVIEALSFLPPKAFPAYMKLSRNREEVEVEDLQNQSVGTYRLS